MKSKSAFIRHLILYGYVYDVNYEHLREYNTILSLIGNNLNQIAKRMNATGNVYEADVKEVKELMKQVWQSQKSMLSKQFGNSITKIFLIPIIPSVIFLQITNIAILRIIPNSDEILPAILCSGIIINETQTLGYSPASLEK